MFKLVEMATYWWPVEVRTPLADDPGNFEAQTFDVQYLYLDVQEHKALTDEAAEQNLTDPEILPRIVTGFRHIEVGGADLAFSPESLERLARAPGVANAIVREYWASRAKAAEKN